MKLVIHPTIDEARLARIREAAGTMQVVNAGTDVVLKEIADADAFFGKLTPPLLRAAGRLKWVQSPTASLEHYLFDELVEHPCALSNMRGLFSDVIADHVLGFVICFARHFHVYLRNQLAGRWEAVGGEAGRSDFATGPGIASSIDRSHRHLADCALGIVGAGAIGQEVGRRAHAFGMTVLAVDPRAQSIPGVCDVWPTERLNDLLHASDFVVIAAPHTPETEKLFRRPQFAAMKRDAVLINVGRGAIVDLVDLTAALQEGLIAGAGLDVF
ncbi:MAG: D-2-hydroxyacid dehydrogenase, partial [Planctomycetia bacterium]|nr:D-2-hydroxyacid dehydrogenase [Planctomycetia bacterium]